MARSRDPAKREVILRCAKRLFAGTGFADTSMSGLAAEAGVPVGSLYTYFSGKEAILDAIVEEGWGEFRAGLEAGLEPITDHAARLSYLVRKALPALFVDVELISILLGESGRLARLDEKLDYLAGMVAGFIAAMRPQTAALTALPPRMLKTALAVFLLGSLDTVRLSGRAELIVSGEDVVEFVTGLAESAFGVSLPR